jgi:hypothetical protein
MLARPRERRTARQRPAEPAIGPTGAGKRHSGDARRRLRGPACPENDLLTQHPAVKRRKNPLFQVYRTGSYVNARKLDAIGRRGSEGYPLGWLPTLA